MKLYEKFFSQILILLTIIILITFIIYGYSYNQYNNQITKNYKANKKRAFNQYLTLISDSIHNTLNNNAKWTDLNMKLDPHHDHWIYENAGGFLVEDKFNNINYVWITDKRTYSHEVGATFPPNIKKYLIKTSFSSIRKINSVYVKYNGDLYWLHYTQITNNHFKNPNGIFVIGTKITHPFIKASEKMLNFESFSLSGETSNTSAPLQVIYPIKLYDNTVEDIAFFYKPPLSIITFNHLLKKALLISIICFISIFILYTYYMYKEARSINYLSKEISKISDGSHHIKLRHNNTAELNSLIISVNKMKDNIIKQMKTLEQQSLDTLKTLNKTLEYTD